MIGSAAHKGGFLFAAVIIAAFFAAPTHASAQVGISPAGIMDSPVMQDGAREESVTLIRSQGIDEIGRYETYFWGEGAEYLTGDDVVLIPAGRDRAEYSFDIDAEGAPIGTYEAYIDFIPKSTGDLALASNANEVRNRSGVTLAVTFGVTISPIQAYEVKNGSVSPVEENIALRVSYVAVNNGNMEWRPDEITILVTDDFGNTVFEANALEDSMYFVGPGAEYTQTLDFEHNMPAGEHNLQMEAIYNNEVIYRFLKRIEVFPAGTLEQKGELVEFYTDQSEYRYEDEIFVTARFENTGDTSYNATLITLLFQKNSALSIHSSESISVDPGKEVSFTTTLDPIGSGDFRVMGLVEYGENTTPPKKVEINVGTKTPPWWLAIFIGLLPLLMLLYWAVRRRTLKAEPQKV
ncbi:MAG: hypothetical protein ABIA47_04675 [bacterium]